jgi:hypothetical protein
MARDSNAYALGALGARDAHDIPDLALAPQPHHEQDASYYQKTL